MALEGGRRRHRHERRCERRRLLRIARQRAARRSTAATGISGGSRRIPTRPLLAPLTLGDGVKYEEIVVLTGPRRRSTRSRRRTAHRSACISPAGGISKGRRSSIGDLKPYQVAMVVITRDGRVIGLKPSAMLLPEPTMAPLTTELPGRHLERERLVPATR
jgi:hypothetical protein